MKHIIKSFIHTDGRKMHYTKTQNQHLCRIKQVIYGPGNIFSPYHPEMDFSSMLTKGWIEVCFNLTGTPYDFTKDYGKSILVNIETKELNEHNDPFYLSYLEECKKGPGGKVSYEDLNSNQYPRSYEHFYRYKDTELDAEFKNKWHK